MYYSHFGLKSQKGLLGQLQVVNNYKFAINSFQCRKNIE